MSLTAMDLKDLNYIAFRSDTHPQPEQEKIFIADSSTSVNLTGSIKGMMNLKELKMIELLWVTEPRF